jgi:hypothetical protein
MKKILTPRTLIASLGIAVLLLADTFGYILVEQPAGRAGLNSGSTSLGLSASAVFTIYPAPSSTPLPLGPTSTPLAPTPTGSPTPAPGQIAVGDYVQVNGTGGIGLRIHSQPSLEADSPILAYEAEAFLVSGGPVKADGYTWWHLTASYDPTRSGWAVQDYLSVLASP